MRNYYSVKGKTDCYERREKDQAYANIGEVKDLGAVLQNDAEGIGLFRSEFLYLQSDHFPTEEDSSAPIKQLQR